VSASASTGMKSNGKSGRCMSVGKSAFGHTTP
jgi:hypothetical protein